MNRKQFIKNLVSQFEEQIRNLPDNKLEELESGKLEISLTQAVGHEAGGAALGAASARGKNVPSISAASPQKAVQERQTTRRLT
ncbi:MULTISPECIES: hypothetical protein [Legionella]|uniref:Uncharacterized protein n=1 Tax=Legionella drozanskii LLAP-1 TaxID=1212489 RepID=A0A0W0SR56_9GAMM|nr:MULTISPECIES: hypothetical protein [Legionella]KTC85764.1 hypothetical protein Ldro_2089 [Legionella drozanskii LLAP-1]PJE16642.1 MAG: hypothetical protein CK430_03150 [Legionella sp.]